MASGEIAVRRWEDCGDLWARTDENNLLDLEHPPAGFALYGAEPEPATRRAALIVSQLPRHIDAGSRWLGAVRSGVKHIVDHRWSIVSSYGGTNWDYITWCAARFDIRLWVVSPPVRLERFRSVASDLTGQLQLDPARTTFVVPVTGDSLPKAERLHLRDRVLFHMAHHRFPIVIRKGGFWEKFIENAPGLDARFQAPRPEPLQPAWNRDRSWMIHLEDRDWNGTLIHWTRGTYGPWSGETTADYFEALTDTASGNPRDGLATLAHIFSSGVLRGEGRMIRRRVPVVSFSENHPWEVLKSIRYRPALGRWNFEPYGIVVPKSKLVELGARPVIYGADDEFNLLPTELKPFFQFKGRYTRGNAASSDWTAEKEWRLVGDLDLDSISDHVSLIVPTRNEAQRLRRLCGGKVVPLESSGR